MCVVLGSVAGALQTWERENKSSGSGARTETAHREDGRDF